MTALKDKIQKRQIPLDVSKDKIIESEVFSALIEMNDIRGSIGNDIRGRIVIKYFK